MREPPANLANDAISACLRDRFGFAIEELTFLPLGHDPSAWVYRARAAGGTTYFLKVRLGGVNAPSLVVPRYLHDHGVAQVVAPLPATNGALWAELGDFALIVYPFITGASGMDRGMSLRQWEDYGSILRRVHDTVVSRELMAALRHEPFAPEWTEAARRVDVHIGTHKFDDTAQDTLARFWQCRRGEIRGLLGRAEILGRRLAQAAPPLVLCHADIHTANVLIDEVGQVRFVDWDEAILAPRERDLMFVIGGIGSDLVKSREEEAFFRGYGPVTIDPTALAYYRYTWAVGEIGAFGAQVFLRPDFGPETRREGAELLIRQFDPGEIVALAYASDPGEERE